VIKMGLMTRKDMASSKRKKAEMYLFIIPASKKLDSKHSLKATGLNLTLNRVTEDQRQ